MERETPPPSWKIPLKLSILFRIPPLAQLILFCFSIRVRASTTKMFPWLIQGCATIKRSIGVSLYQRTSSISTPIQPLNKIWIERKNSLPDHCLSGLSCNRRAQCYDNEEGEKYDGCVSTTATGWPCQVWNDQPNVTFTFCPKEWASATNKTGKEIYLSQEGNFCRNPDNHTGPW